MNYRTIRTVIFAVLALLCTSVCLAGTPQYRAYWVSTWSTGIGSASAVDSLISRVQEANCNVILAQVRRRADSYYPSPLEPWCTDATSSFDSLAYLIKKAHAATPRIEVHAYMVTVPAFKSGMDINTGHPSTLYPQFFTKNADGTTSSDDFDPGHPECLKHIADVYLDVVNRYDVDGIHYDYVRFNSGGWGYNDQSVARFNACYNRTGTPANSDSTWSQWRRDQVSALVRQIYARTLAATINRERAGFKPWLTVSGSTITWGNGPGTNDAGWTSSSAYSSVYQDWRSWMQEGILDCNMPMTYYDYSSLPSYYNNWTEFQKNNKYNRHLAIGLGAYLNTIPDTYKEIAQGLKASSRGKYADGFAIFRYDYPNLAPVDVAGFHQMLTTPNADNSNNPPFASNVPAPSLPWKEAPTLGNLMGVVTQQSGTQSVAADFASVSITGPESRTQRVDGTGFYAFIDLKPGTYTVTATKTGVGTKSKTVSVQAGQIPAQHFHLGGTDTTAPTLSGVDVIRNTSGQAQILTDSKAIVVWNTDEPADSQVEYGFTTSYGSTTPVDSMLSGTRLGYQNVPRGHLVTLTNLSAGKVYHYRVISRDSSGNVSTSTDKSFVTSGTDSTPPGLDNIQATAITNTSATITWATLEPANSQVEYGTTESYGSVTTLDTAMGLSHAVKLTGLTPNTKYHYRVRSMDAARNWAVSWDFNFTTAATDTIPPVISNVVVSGVTTTSATITWTTDEPATTRAEYGMTSGLGTPTPVTPGLATSHSITLTGLTPSATYYFQVLSADEAGNESASAASSFTTLTPDTTAPTITNVRALGITSGRATIAWTTSEPSTSLVEYGSSASYGSSSNQDAALVTNHSVAITGLKANSVYHYRVKSDDASGNHAISDDYYFTIGYNSLTIDNTDPGFQAVSGDWKTVNTAMDRYGSNYLTASNADPSGAPSAVARWTPEIPVSGNWEVYAWWPTVSSQATSATYEVHYKGGSTTVTVDQTSDAGTWYQLGTFPMDPGTGNYVTLGNNADPSTGLVAADAVRFTPASQTCSSPSGIVQNGWNLIALPAAPLNPNPTTVLSAINFANASLQYWDNGAVANGFVSYGPVTGWYGPLQVGTPYWFLNTDGPKTISFSGTEQISDFQMTIPAHSTSLYWVMVGQPFNHETPCDEISFSTPAYPTPLKWAEAYRAGIVESKALCYQDRTYVTAGPSTYSADRDRFEPWRGYWLLLRVGGPVTITIPVASQ